MISIILPVYNVEQYLEECLESILNQTYQNFEVICVNDASPDNSLKILEKYAQKDNRFKVINHKKNKGVSVTRNTAIKKAKSEYITFVDADDKLDPTYLETLAKYRDKADFVEANFTVFPKEFEQMFYQLVKNFNFNKPSGIYKISPTLLSKTFMSPWSKLLKKSIIDKYKIKFPKGRVYEDISFIYRYLLHCKTLYYINKKIYYYRKNNSKSITANYKKIYDDHAIQSFLDVCKYVDSHNFLPNYKKSMVLILCRAYSDWFKWLPEKFLDKYKKHFIKVLKLKKYKNLSSIKDKLKITIADTFNKQYEIKNVSCCNTYHNKNYIYYSFENTVIQTYKKNFEFSVISKDSSLLLFDISPFNDKEKIKLLSFKINGLEMLNQSPFIISKKTPFIVNQITNKDEKFKISLSIE